MARVRDNNRIPDLARQLQQINRNKIQLVIDAPSGDKLFTVAWVHEYGFDIKVTPKMRGWFLGQGMPLKKSTTHIHIPERSYFRSGFDANQGSINKKAEELLDLLIQGNATAYEINEEIGKFASKKISENVTSVDLVKTGDLRDAIGFKVVRK
ncbi:hypothetical protein [Sporosarcina sp. FSL W7-1283]|uniref:hypothetical protein n=1 Tax=Sporosarcina sp. FSL W7-1283 TaxID=2921560 RepID=UPI0030F67FC3